MNLTESIKLYPSRFRDADHYEIVINIAPGEPIDTDEIIDNLCRINGFESKSIYEDDYLAARNKIEEYIDRFYKSHSFVKVWLALEDMDNE